MTEEKKNLLLFDNFVELYNKNSGEASSDPDLNKIILPGIAKTLADEKSIGYVTAIEVERAYLEFKEMHKKLKGNTYDHYKKFLLSKNFSIDNIDVICSKLGSFSKSILSEKYDQVDEIRTKFYDTSITILNNGRLHKESRIYYLNEKIDTIRNNVKFQKIDTPNPKSTIKQPKTIIEIIFYENK